MHNNDATRKANGYCSTSCLKKAINTDILTGPSCCQCFCEWLAHINVDMANKEVAPIRKGLSNGMLNAQGWLPIMV